MQWVWESSCDGMQVKVLESLLSYLKDYFHADGAGIPMGRLESTATRAERLFQLFVSPTEGLGTLHASIYVRTSMQTHPCKCMYVYIWI
jgi:hypothetical protein